MWSTTIGLSGLSFPDYRGADRARRGMPGCGLHRLSEYIAQWVGLGLLGAISLSGSLASVPLYYLLPKRWADPLGRWVQGVGLGIEGGHGLRA